MPLLSVIREQDSGQLCNVPWLVAQLEVKHLWINYCFYHSKIVHTHTLGLGRLGSGGLLQKSGASLLHNTRGICDSQVVLLLLFMPAGWSACQIWKRIHTQGNQSRGRLGHLPANLVSQQPSPAASASQPLVLTPTCGPCLFWFRAVLNALLL